VTESRRLELARAFGLDASATAQEIAEAIATKTLAGTRSKTAG
jgi:hypothetical protein